MSFAKFLIQKQATLFQKRTIVGKKITNAFLNHKDVVQKKLQSALAYIHLSIDIWTFPNNLFLLGITADFVNYKEGKHTKALIILPEVDSHSGQA